ncbi:hypothetical protein D3C85_1841600 [compost metagenome]
MRRGIQDYRDIGMRKAIDEIGLKIGFFVIDRCIKSSSKMFNGCGLLGIITHNFLVFIVIQTPDLTNN